MLNIPQRTLDKNISWNKLNAQSTNDSLDS